MIQIILNLTNMFKMGLKPQPRKHSCYIVGSREKTLKYDTAAAAAADDGDSGSDISPLLENKKHAHQLGFRKPVINSRICYR